MILVLVPIFSYQMALVVVMEDFMWLFMVCLFYSKVEESLLLAKFSCRYHLAC